MPTVRPTVCNENQSVNFVMTDMTFSADKFQNRVNRHIHIKECSLAQRNKLLSACLIHELLIDFTQSPSLSFIKVFKSFSSFPDSKSLTFMGLTGLLYKSNPTYGYDQFPHLTTGMHDQQLKSLHRHRTDLIWMGVWWSVRHLGGTGGNP